MRWLSLRNIYKGSKKKKLNDDIIQIFLNFRNKFSIQNTILKIQKYKF
jgi:hypothetical protein